MTDALLVVPAGGWTVDDLDALPESHHRYELTDGALTVSPSRSSLHQSVAMRLGVHLEAAAPEPLAVTQAVEIRFGRQLIGTGPRLTVSDPFTVDIVVADLLPRWAGRGEGPTVPAQGL